MIVDVNTLALQYALGELNATEVEAFETRLETDQAAREALADAVLVMGAVRRQPQAATRPAESPVSISRRSRLVAFASCTAAGLAVVALLKTPEGPVLRSNGEVPAIVGTWSELGAEETPLTDVDSEFADDADSDIPDWMVAAVLDADESAPGSEGTL
ncbi:MAG TPA: hypothetical protein VM452_00865 [Caulifigura sp.]|jgi:anti-sigma-K factor RskA|nr:hypothetical protein [Caulifigura sp.]